MAVGKIPFEFIPGTDFCPCISVVVFEMYSLIGSLAVMRDREAGTCGNAHACVAIQIRAV